MSTEDTLSPKNTKSSKKILPFVQEPKTQPEVLITESQLTGSFKFLPVGTLILFSSPLQMPSSLVAYLRTTNGLEGVGPISSLTKEKVNRTLSSLLDTEQIRRNNNNEL